MLPWAPLAKFGLALRPLSDPSRLELIDIRIDALPRWVLTLLLSVANPHAVRHLVAHNCSGVTDQLLCRLCAAAPGIETMSLRSATDGGFTGHGVRLAALQQLQLEGSGVDDEAVAQITAGCPALYGLTLVGAPRLCAVPVRSTSIRVVRLQRCERVSDAAIGAICEGCCGLEVLHIDECRALTAPVLHSPTLTRLHLGECSGLENAVLSGACFRLPALSALSVTYCSQPGLTFDDAAWPASLRDIALDGCAALSDAALGRLSRMCSRLERLAARSCQQLQAPLVESISLTEIDFGSCEHLAPSGVAVVLAGCPRLIRLELGGCDQLQSQELSQYVLD